MPEKISLFVPGRLCLFGEHGDFSGMHRVINANIIPEALIVTGIEQGIHADVEIFNKFLVLNTRANVQEYC